MKASGPTLRGLGPGARVTLRGRDGSEFEHRVSSVAGEGERIILRLDAVTDRDAASELVQHEIFVAESAVPPIEDADTFYVRELVGFRVRLGDEVLGEVADVVPGPANDSLDVRGGPEPVLIPFTEDAVVSIDRDHRLLEVRRGLLAP